jgi:indolepyruvate ferredoxin oxidoreductase
MSAEDAIRHACGTDRVALIPAGDIATALMGDNIATNMFMLGYAWQKGWVPLSEASIMRAIELNGVSIPFNKSAFDWGRKAAFDLAAVQRITTPATVIEFKRAPSLDAIIAKRVQFLTEYQNAGYAKQYADFVAQVRAAESKVAETSTRLTEAVAKYLFKLMAYKDEYEVGRLHSSPVFAKKIADMFEGDYKINFHLAPPMMAKRDAKGHLVKQKFGPWMMQGFKLLANLKSLRGTPFDIFGYTAERKMERALPVEYREIISALLAQLTKENLTKAVAIASIPEEIRGYGHVKERHLALAHAKQQKLLASLNDVAEKGKQVA